MTERKRTLPVVLADKDTAFKVYGVDALPQVVVVDHTGTIVKHWVGLRREDDLRAALQPLLAK
jgi:hypothetical protein